MVDPDHGAEPDEGADRDDGVDPDNGAKPDNEAEPDGAGALVMGILMSLISSFIILKFLTFL